MYEVKANEELIANTFGNFSRNIVRNLFANHTPPESAPQFERNFSTFAVIPFTEFEASVAIVAMKNIYDSFDQFYNRLYDK